MQIVVLALTPLHIRRGVSYALTGLNVSVKEQISNQKNPLITINAKFYFGGKVFAEVEGFASYLNEAELALAVKCGAINHKLNECNMFTFCEFAEVEAVKNYRSLQTIKVENPLCLKAEEW